MTVTPAPLGLPRVHLRVVDSTNLRARALADAGAPHGTLITAAAQSAGRGRQGRAWSAPPGTSLLMSLVIRDPPSLIPLRAGIAVAETAEATLGDASGADRVTVKWPNDVLIDGRKVAGILVEGRPQQRWAVLGIGLNVAVRLEDLPEQLRDRATTLGQDPTAIEAVLTTLLAALERTLAAPQDGVLTQVRDRDALRGRAVSWDRGRGTAAGIDEHGRLLVDTGADVVALDAGEVHLNGLAT